MTQDPQDRKRTFDRAADLYNEVRPGYPQALVDDTIALSAIPQNGRILEIGCGTGQATAAFAACGYGMLCLDIGRNLATIAADRFRAYHNVRIVVESFEEWQPDGPPFDLVIAATSFHWIDPSVRYRKAGAVLKLSGALAVIHNNHIRGDEGFFLDVEAIYRRYAPLSKDASPQKQTFQPAVEPGLEAFGDAIRKSCPWSQEYDADQYIRLLGTYSDHIALPASQRDPLLAGIRELINDR